jgi:hypothetical protein
LTDGNRNPESILSLDSINDNDPILESLTQETGEVQVFEKVLQERFCHLSATGGDRSRTPEFDEGRT